MWRSCKQKDGRGEIEDDVADEDHLICIMRGNDWEALPYPIIVDSGASASTLPKSWCQHVKLWETAESKSGQGFHAANGHEIPNLGRKQVTLMTKDGAIRDMKFEVCDVTRALGSVSQMCKAGHKVVFNPPWDQSGSYIQHFEIGQKPRLTEKDGIYLVDMRVAPVTSSQAFSIASSSSISTVLNSSFNCRVTSCISSSVPCNCANISWPFLSICICSTKPNHIARHKPSG